MLNLTTTVAVTQNLIDRVHFDAVCLDLVPGRHRGVARAGQLAVEAGERYDKRMERIYGEEGEGVGEGEGGGEGGEGTSEDEWEEAGEDEEFGEGEEETGEEESERGSGERNGKSVEALSGVKEHQNRKVANAEEGSAGKVPVKQELIVNGTHEAHSTRAGKNHRTADDCIAHAMNGVTIMAGNGGMSQSQQQASHARPVGGSSPAVAGGASPPSAAAPAVTITSGNGVTSQLQMSLASAQFFLREVEGEEGEAEGERWGDRSLRMLLRALWQAEPDMRERIWLVREWVGTTGK